MRLVNILVQRLRSLFSRARLDKDLDEELRYHLERQIDEDVARGVSREDARRAALRDFQDVQQRKEACRDMRGWNVMDNLRQDLRFALRQLGKNPGFTCTAILMLSLGLCASVAIFAFVDAALISPLPYREPSRLVGVYERIPICPECDLSYLDFLDWKKLNKVFVSLEAYTSNGLTVRTKNGVEPARAANISDGFFRILGVAPSLGRDFLPGEDRPDAPHTVILSHASWQKRYGGKPDVLGHTVTLDDVAYVIVGVLPQRFHFAPVGSAEFWIPLNASGSCERRRSCHNLYGVARLLPGVSTQVALANMVSIAQELEKQYPDSNHGQGANILPLVEVMVGKIRPILLVLLGGAGLLLLIACVNVASLLLVRSEGRRRELAVRSALGASRVRIIRQFVTEGLVLVAISSALGAISAAWTMKLLVRLIPVDMMTRMPFLLGLGFTTRVSIFACAVSFAAAVLFALTPALRLSVAGIREGLTEGSRGSAGTSWRRLGSKLVIVELATAMVLLVVAGLLGQSLYRLLRVDLGFQPNRLVSLMVAASDVTYGKHPQAIALERRIVSGFSALPGVESVGLTSVLPVSFNGNTTWIRFAGRPFHGEHNEVNYREVSSEYFQTIGAKLLRGRYFTDAEDESKPGVAIINQTLASKYFPGEDPIGKQIGDLQLSSRSLRQIIGIVDDLREGALDAEIWPAEYIPFNQSPSNGFNVVVRASHAGQSLMPELLSTIHGIDRDIVTLNGTDMETRISDSPSAYMHRSSAWLVGGFATLALLLSVIGLYGVIAYSVSQRTREIGVRMALGARPSTVYGMVLKEAGWLTGIGIAAGLLCSLGAASMMQKLLFGVRSWDVPTLAGVAAVLGIASMVACYLPARNAASVNPVDALRAE